MGSTYDKGLPLELYLHDIFKSYGYNVFHNVGKEGRSGVIHQINLYAEYQAPCIPHASLLKQNPMINRWIKIGLCRSSR